jgi:hypothetical protein
MDVFSGKQAVLSLVERGGALRSFHVANVTAKTLRPILFKTAPRGSHLMTDGTQFYIKAGEDYAAHSRLDHVSGGYVREGFHHSNTIENSAKRTCKATGQSSISGTLYVSILV